MPDDLDAPLTAVLREAAQAAFAAARAAGLALDDGLAALEPPRRRLWGTRPARMRPLGRGLRLGTLILQTSAHDRHGDEPPALWGAGETLRAHQPPPILGYTSESARARDDLRRAAIRGGYQEGEVVHYGLHPLDATTIRLPGSPIAVRAGAAVVPWRPGAALASAPLLRDYLLDRVELQRHPREA